MSVSALNLNASGRSPIAAGQGVQRVSCAGKSRVCFATSVSCILLLTVIAEIIAILQQKSFLRLPDPVMSSMTVRQSLLLAIVLEISFAVYIFVLRKRLSTMVGCSWLVSTFVCYRMLAYSFFSKKPCPCLGEFLIGQDSHKFFSIQLQS